MKTAIKILGPCALASIVSLWTTTAFGLDTQVVSQGSLPGGKVLQVLLITINPGEGFPWHYHTGPGWGTIVSGTLTEDEGCGTALSVLNSGASFSERPGKVHMVTNLGTTPVVMTWVEIYPGCDPDQGTVFVTGPRCEGRSGRSHLEPIPS